MRGQQMNLVTVVVGVGSKTADEAIHVMTIVPMKREQMQTYCDVKKSG